MELPLVVYNFRKAKLPSDSNTSASPETAPYKLAKLVVPIKRSRIRKRLLFKWSANSFLYRACLPVPPLIGSFFSVLPDMFFLFVKLIPFITLPRLLKITSVNLIKVSAPLVEMEDGIPILS